jgi:hypothetical protein
MITLTDTQSQDIYLQQIRKGQIVWKQSLLSDKSAYLFKKFQVLGFNTELIVCQSYDGGSFLLGFDWQGHSVSTMSIDGKYRESGNYVRRKDSSDVY